MKSFSLARNLRLFSNSCVYNSNKNLVEGNSKYRRKIFSGIQPTGSVHLGNYLGAIKQWIELQNNNEDMLLSIVDLHSVTLPQDPKTLPKNILEMAATLIACGIDCEKTVLFQQSTVPQHTELFWQLSCISTMARLGHLPQFKEKSASLKDVPLGLFIYPVLQAADILLYKATHVPVGEDQLQHLQLTQDLGRMFNNKFGNIFPIPHSMLPDKNVAKLRSLRDPTKKMSKSDPDPKSRICLMDSPDDIVKKLKKAVTDCTSQVTFDPNERQGVSNLLCIHSSVTGKSIDDICKDVKDLDTGKYKLVVADEVIAALSTIRSKILELLSDTYYLTNLLQEGTKKASEQAEKTMEEVRYKVGYEYKSLLDKKSKIFIKQ